ncbi:MAG: helix-turn-helix transcriptional regulator [Paracoccaceae bacterium]
MRRADRLFQIVQYLRGGRLTTAQILAEKLEVSERTIYRDIADLIGSGVPIDGEAGVGYIMRAGYDIPPLMFSKAEFTALVAGARILRSFGGAAMSLAAEEALIKIESVLPEGLRDTASSVPIHTLEIGAVSPETRLKIDRLEAAAQSRLRITFDYLDEEGASTKRTIRPLGLWFWGKVWTVVGWCELRNDFRMFRIDRIENAIEGAPFRPEPDKTLARFYEIQERRGPRRQVQ